jgi:RNA polymerase sigma-70 factor (ECF subfamily)
VSRPDADILERAHAGDREAIGSLIEPELDRVYATCRRMVGNADDAAELAQDAVVRAIRGIGTYDGRSAFSTWLTRVTMNTCLSWHRSRGRRKGIRAASLDNADTFPDRGTRPGGEPGGGDGVQEGGPRASLVEAGLERLKPEHRAVLVLRDVRELDYDAIGAALDLPLGTVKSRISRARVALREAIVELEAAQMRASTKADTTVGTDDAAAE